LDDLVERYFAAMERGRLGVEDVLALFTEDAAYVEPFSGGVHTGRDAIRAWLSASWETAPRDLRLTLDRLEASGDVAEAEWTRESSDYARPARGRDRFTIRHGKIARVESTLTQPPEPR
jgi:uncharacterized protein (TIGR02246 family)